MRRITTKLHGNLLHVGGDSISHDENPLSIRPSSLMPRLDAILGAKAKVNFGLVVLVEH